MPREDLPAEFDMLRRRYPGKGVTSRATEAGKALAEGRVKAALSMTNRDRMEREHQIVVDVGKKCLADKEKCMDYCQDGARELRDRITTPMDSTDLEGVEEMLAGEKPRPTGEAPTTTETPVDSEVQSDEEAYENCQECHVSDAVVKFHKIAEHCGDKGTMEEIDATLKDDLTTPQKWIKTMVGIAEKPSCGQGAMQEVLGELTEYLEKKDSPILKELDEEKSDG